MVDILNTFPGRPLSFRLMPRQELARTAGGRNIAKDIGDALWFGEWQSKPLRPNDADYWEAVLDKLAITMGTFDGYDMYRRRPILHPGTTVVPGPITINAVGGDNTSFTLSGAVGLHLRVGDMLQVDAGGDLYRIESDSDNGATTQVMPQLWPSTANGDAVSVLKPHCPMIVMPGSHQAPAGLDGWSVVSFQAVEARD